ncbi:MAG TPA: hypothetical protein VL949_12290, partial [Geobacteraceae bacterium]|nr:hypothetical protein [Geobacteraceae bacterium]
DEGGSETQKPEFLRPKVAGDPDTDKKSCSHSDNIVNKQPSGIPDGLLQVVTPFEPLPDESRQVSDPALVHVPEIGPFNLPNRQDCIWHQQ